MPGLFIIAGPNGAGKTTVSKTFLPEILGVKEFVNADEIARGLSPYNPEGAAFEAGRLMLNRIKKLIKEGVDFGFETTLATRSYRVYINEAKKMGYTITLCFLWLPSPEAAKQRVAERVRQGGHNVPEEVIERRYHRGLENFFKIYIHQADEWIVMDNTGHPHRLVAEGEKGKAPLIHTPVIWRKIKQYEN